MSCCSYLKEQQVTPDEIQHVEDMIDDEQPLPGIPGRFSLKNQKKTAEERKQERNNAQAAKQKALEDKIEQMSPEERKEFKDQQMRVGYMKKAKLSEIKLNNAVKNASKLEGKLMSMKKSPYLNPEKIMTKLRAHKMQMKIKLDKLMTTVGSAPNVNTKTLAQKNFQAPIDEAGS